MPPVFGSASPLWKAASFANAKEYCFRKSASLLLHSTGQNAVSRRQLFTSGACRKSNILVRDSFQDNVCRKSFRSSGHHNVKKGLFYELGVLFSKERRDARRKALQEEVTRGRFHELNELKATGGKLFEGDTKLLPAQGAVIFPNTEGSDLTGTATSTSNMLGGKVTLLTVCVRDIARPMIVSWTQPFLAKFAQNQHVQAMDMFFVEGSLYRMIQGMMLSSIRNRIPQESWKSTLVSFNSSEELRKELAMSNRLVAYVFLIDSERRIRWKGVGYAQPHEMKALLDAAASLAKVRH